MEASAHRGAEGQPLPLAEGSPANAGALQPPVKASEVREWEGSPVERLPAACTLVGGELPQEAAPEAAKTAAGASIHPPLLRPPGQLQTIAAGS